MRYKQRLVNGRELEARRRSEGGCVKEIVGDNDAEIYEEIGCRNGSCFMSITHNNKRGNTHKYMDLHDCITTQILCRDYPFIQISDDDKDLFSGSMKSLFDDSNWEHIFKHNLY